MQSTSPGLFLRELDNAMALLPSFLDNPDGWKSLLVDYSTPIVERLWRPFNTYRLCLHRITSDDSTLPSLYHKHPWPSAMCILKGAYEMNVGYGTTDRPPPLAATIRLPAGSTYEMMDPNAWHSVTPLSTPVLSVMLTGKPWDSTPSTLQLRPLDEENVNDLLRSFKALV